MPTKPEQPTVLGGVTSRPVSQVDRVAATYTSRSVAPQRSPADIPPAARAQLTQTQRVARTYAGDSSATISQGLAFVTYRKLAEAAGVDSVTATKALDGLLAFDPSSVPPGAKMEDVIRARALATGIDPGDAQRCVAAFLALGDEPGKMTP